MAYDADREVSVLFGGFNGITFFNETWEWDGTTWTQQTALTGSPAGRADHVMAFDALRHRVVLFGGIPGLLGDTWVYGGSIQCPALSEWGMMAMAALMLSAGGVVIARRRAA
jgi:hypothetical protein